MLKKRTRKIRIILGVLAVLILISAAASVIGPVKAFSDTCSEFFSFDIDMSDRLKQVREFYDAYLANMGITLNDLQNLPFDSKIVEQALQYDIYGGNVKHPDGQEVCYRSYEIKTETTVTTETIETTFKHYNGDTKPNKGTFINAGCDNYTSQDEITATGIVLHKYVCNGHTITQEIEHREEMTRYYTYGHYFTIKPSDYLAGYDIPWNVVLALAVVQKYAYNGALEIDDYIEDGEEEFKYKLTKKGIKKIHDMFSSDEGVEYDVKYSYLPFARAQEDVKKMEASGVSDEDIKSSLEYKSSILDEDDVLQKGTYYYETVQSEHPSLSVVVTDIYNYIWHYHYEYDYSSGSPVFVRGSRTSRVENLLRMLDKNKFDESAADLLIAVVDAMPGGSETAATLEFLFDHYNDIGTEYTETLYDGIVYRMKEERMELIEKINEEL